MFDNFAVVSLPAVVRSNYADSNEVTLQHGRCEEFLLQIDGPKIQLAVTSPPYNIGKKYGKKSEKKQTIEQYIAEQKRVIMLCTERLTPTGSICWQVGNHVVDNEVYPIDIMLFPVFRELGFVLRNRIVWHFEHGFHGYQRLSGRHETILWFTRPGDNYTFNLDPIRVPQKYPGKKYYKGPRAGQYSANPKGKNPGDVWVIPNVKHNHIEKTVHPCQFPVELIERLVLSLTSPGDLVVDPYMGVGSTAVAALKHGRRVAGADVVDDYIKIATRRVIDTSEGRIRTRPMDRPVYRPQGKLTEAPWRSSELEDTSDDELLASR
jgi:adenine-specific DNA-methyltransferase